MAGEKGGREDELGRAAGGGGQKDEQGPHAQRTLDKYPFDIFNNHLKSTLETLTVSDRRRRLAVGEDARRACAQSRLRSVIQDGLSHGPGSFKLENRRTLRYR